VWAAFAVLILGSIWRLYMMITQARQEKVVYPYMSARYGVRSLFRWSVPFGSRNMRLNPIFTILSYLFHIGLIVTPIFAAGHVLLFKESWNISWWTLPESLTTLMTIMVVVTGIIFILRRFADPSVRNVSGAREFLLLILVILPFVTGLMAYYQLFDYRTIIVIHMLSGELWLMAIPFTWLSHMFYFPFTRSYMGSEFGYVRNARDW
jgi:nitrate reductase gamma subunit